MPAGQKIEYAEQRPLAEWSGYANLQAQLAAVGDDEAARSALIATIPEGYKWSADEANQVKEVVNSLRDDFDAHAADNSVHGGNGSPTALASVFTTDNPNTGASTVLTHDLNERAITQAQAISDAQAEASQGVSKADNAQSTANQAVSNASAAQTTADNAGTAAAAAQSTADGAQSDATDSRTALDIVGKTYAVPNNTTFAAPEQPTATEIKAYQVANYPSLAEHALFRYETADNVLWLFSMDKDGTMHFANKHDPGMEGGIYVVPVSSPDTLRSDVHANKLRHYRITATSPTVAVTTPDGDVQAVEFPVPVPLKTTDKFRVERQSTSDIWLNGTFEGDSPIIDQDQRSLMITAKSDLSGWYWSKA
ncbi:hypothetical protein [uncultured Paraglaciecola sp.]|uniref:hypothetical protein n=1 Tax=uncultured Paraglaciecola sp. TaxID=1765024 RepID=UPI00262D60F8|nr:hypothetical protein [uncultured Paraglaciecola sp.]